MRKLLQRSDYLADKFPVSGSVSEQIIFLLGYAVMAPSTHNIQPWKFRVKNNICEFFLDKSLALAKADPSGRDAYISLGCCAENLVIAAKHFGIFQDLKTCIDTESGKVAEIIFKQGSGEFDKKDEGFFRAISERFDARGEFSDSKLGPEMISLLNSENDFQNLRVDIVAEAEKINAVADLTASGMRAAHADKDFRYELSHYITHSFSSRPDGIPAHSMRMPAFISPFFPSVLRKIDLSAVLAKLNKKSINSSAAVVVVSSLNNDPESWFNTGRLSERLMLRVWSLGFKSSIYVASVEIGDRYKQVRELVGRDWRPQFLFCVGKMNLHIKPTARWAVSYKMLTI